MRPRGESPQTTARRASTQPWRRGDITTCRHVVELAKEVRELRIAKLYHQIAKLNPTYDVTSWDDSHGTGMKKTRTSLADFFWQRSLAADTIRLRIATKTNTESVSRESQPNHYTTDHRIRISLAFCKKTALINVNRRGREKDLLPSTVIPCQEEPFRSCSKRIQRNAYESQLSVRV